MQKIKCALVIFFLAFACCGCSDAQIKPVLSNIGFTARIERQQEQYECSCLIEEDGKVSVTVNKPESLCGMTAVYTEEEQYLEYNGIRSETNWPNSHFTSVTDYISLIPKMAGESAEAQGDEFVITERLGEEKCKFYFSPAGIPLKMTADETEITFFDISIINTQHGE